MKAFKSYFHSAPQAKQTGDSEKKPAQTHLPDAAIGLRQSVGNGYVAPSVRSNRPGLFPDGDFRNWDLPQIIEIKCEVMANWLYAQQMENRWCHGNAGEGIVLKKGRDAYTTCPKELMSERGGLYDAVRGLHVRCAMTVSTGVIKLFLRGQELSFVPLPDGLKLQIIPSLSHLPQCQKHHFAAFIQDIAIVVVWDDDPRHILDRVRSLEDELMKMTWKGSSVYGDEGASNEEINSQPPAIAKDEADGVGSESLAEKPRKTEMVQPWLSAITLALVIGALGTGFRAVAIEIKADGSYVRAAFAAVVPFQIWVALFFMQSLATSVAEILGPISQLTRNSKFYSGKPPRRIVEGPLPHVTIQCPVYKEGLNSVINPTVKSIKQAISTYEMQGGTANLFINDDGMQVISEEDARARRDYYDEHNIGWVARPGHNSKLTIDSTPFVRAGKFKKASNMNYALDVSARVEDKLASIPRSADWTQWDETEAYQEAFRQVIEEDEGRTWAEGNVRIGDYILLIDSDTRVPKDCLLDAVSEMESAPQVAIIQFVSGVMNVTDSFFENGITFFTNLVYTAIRFAVANGDIAPFVGHNAILRWSAVQDIAYDTPERKQKYWSESTVSEDFDMALRLQCSGYVIRLGAYTGSGFKEGVSLTVYDELARWEKYAYGCSELIFHPFKSWLFKGPFTPLFRTFIFSRMPLPSKVTIMSYIGTYYALASALPLSLMNYFIIGWFNGFLDHYYLDSFKIHFAVVMVFTGGNVALAILRYRLGERTLVSALVESVKWIPLLFVFLGGVSLHLLQAILSHMFSINMTWGATAKEATETNFFEELPNVLKKFKWMFLTCLSIVAVMIILATGLGGLIEYHWRIRFFTVAWPLATSVASHILLPIALNPGLMLFTW